MAVPVVSLENSSITELQGSLWQLEPWMPGEANFLEQPSKDRLRAAMICLAQWHRAGASFVPTESEAAWFSPHPAAPSPGITERLARISYWNPGRLEEAEHGLIHCDWAEFREAGTRLLTLYRKVVPAIAVELNEAAHWRFALHPCLRDVWHDHLLFSGEKVTGLIDPSACRSETVTTDIARLVGSLVGNDTDSWEMALNAYQEIRPLHNGEQRAIKIFDRSGVLLSAMTWLDHVVLQRHDVRDRTRVLERVRRLLERLEQVVL